MFPPPFLHVIIVMARFMKVRILGPRLARNTLYGKECLQIDARPWMVESGLDQYIHALTTTELLDGLDRRVSDHIGAQAKMVCLDELGIPEQSKTNFQRRTIRPRRDFCEELCDLITNCLVSLCCKSDVGGTSEPWLTVFRRPRCDLLGKLASGNLPQ